jgi:hypothetical protein
VTVTGPGVTSVVTTAVTVVVAVSSVVMATVDVDETSTVEVDTTSIAHEHKADRSAGAYFSSGLGMAAWRGTTAG